MSARNCIDDAIYCPDLKCTKCGLPYTTWVWKERLLFSCPDCNELGFNVDGLRIIEERLPKHSFYTIMEWPCESDPDPDCVKERKMLFIENYTELDLLLGSDADDQEVISENFATAQKVIGEAYDRIIEMICT